MTELPYALPALDPSTPLDIHRALVLPEWVDWNGHMNMAFYLKAFDEAAGAFNTQVGLGRRYVDNKLGMTFAVEVHVTYDREVRGGDRLAFATQLLDHDAKRMHLFTTMRHATEGYVAATNEMMILHIDHATRRPAAFPAVVQERLAILASRHDALPKPAKAGRLIGIPRRPLQDQQQQQQ